MINKTKVVFVLAIGFCILIVSFIMKMVESRPSLDIHHLKSKEVKWIKIYDRGILGSDSLILTKGEDVKEIADSIIGSVKIDYNEVLFKENNGLCEIELYKDKYDFISITLTNTTKTGGILRSGEYCYRNDTLLMNIVNKILTKE